MKISSVMDSGSIDNVTNRQMAPEYPVQESLMSKSGQKYSAAGAGSKGIPNEGQQELLFYSNEGAPVPMRYQVAEVRKPLTSVSKICDRGNRVTFCRNGGYVQNLFTWQCTPLVLWRFEGKKGDGDWRLLIAFRARPERPIIASQTTKGQLIDVGDEGTSSSIE